MRKKFFCYSVVIATVMIISCGVKNNPSYVAEQSIKYLSEQKYTEYVNLYYFEEDTTEAGETVDVKKQQLVSVLKEKANEDLLSDFDSLSSYKAISEVISDDGETAKVGVEMIHLNGVKDTTNIQLQKDSEGIWKIDSGK